MKLFTGVSSTISGGMTDTTEGDTTGVPLISVFAPSALVLLWFAYPLTDTPDYDEFLFANLRLSDCVMALF